MNETQFGAVVYMLSREMASIEGVPYEDPFKQDLQDRAHDILCWLEDEELLVDLDG